MVLTRVLKDLFSSGTRAASGQQGGASDTAPGPDDYNFTVDWFSGYIAVWTRLLSKMPDISKILEIGSYEGRSTVWLMEHAFKPGRKGEIFCIDTWQGGIEHDAGGMPAVEERFRRNIELARSRGRPDVTVRPLKGASTDRLASLIAEGHRLSFDLVYVDGSHEAPDVLSDLVLSFELCRIGGLMICDDYLWSMQAHGKEDLLTQPKLAIDSFVNCYVRKLTISSGGLPQLYIRKTAA